MSNEIGNVRLDKWLWAARFFKTRSLAAQAIDGGKVHVNGERVKRAKNVSVGDELSITRGEVHFIVKVQGLSEQRGPAPVAQQLYEETEESKRQRTEQAEKRRLFPALNPAPTSRPSKKDRRKIIRFTGKS